MVENEPTDPWILGVAPAERRGNYRWHAKSEERLAVHNVGIDAVRGLGAGRWNVLEESAPLVESDDQNRTGPRGSAGDGFEQVKQKPVTFTNVCVAMVVVAGAVVKDGVARVYEGNREKGALLCLLKKSS